jgi:hypothetical protein
MRFSIDEMPSNFQGSIFPCREEPSPSLIANTVLPVNRFPMVLKKILSYSSLPRKPALMRKYRS